MLNEKKVTRETIKCDYLNKIITIFVYALINFEILHTITSRSRALGRQNIKALGDGK